MKNWGDSGSSPCTMSESVHLVLQIFGEALLQATYRLSMDVLDLVLVTESQHGHHLVKIEDAVVRKEPASGPGKKVCAEK